MNHNFNQNDKYSHDSYNDRHKSFSLSYLQSKSQSTHQQLPEPAHRYPQCYNNVSNDYNLNSYQHSSYITQRSGWNKFKKRSDEPKEHDPKSSKHCSQISFQSEIKNDPQSTKLQGYGVHQSTDSQNSGRYFQNHTNQCDKASNNFPTTSTDVNQQINFSNIILYLGNNPKSKLPLLKKSFAESPYGQLDTLTQKFGNMTTVNLSCAGQSLSEGTAKCVKEATIIAACGLFERLQATNYTIVENSSYFTKSRVPNCALNVDSSLKHIYRVVYLECKYQSNFPFPVTGAVEYVQTEHDLLAFLEYHCINHKKIDLFILNIEKSLRRKVSEICKMHNMTYEPINGCSDRGAIARATLDLPSLFQELQNCGGLNLRHRLIPPGQPIGNEFSMSTIKTDGSENNRAKTVDGSSVCKQDVFEDGKDIVVSQWIADHLIIMDLFTNKDSTKETPKEILFCSVKDCNELDEFVIEKKRDKLSGRITGSVLIDRKLVGGATAFTEDTVKMLAAENALQNLKKYCYYIEGNPSYFGTYGRKPEFLYWNAPRIRSTIYKIIDHMDVSRDQDLRQEIWRFKSSCFQDLFLLDNISDKVRNLAFSIGLELKMQVRFFEGGMCIYKKQRPREVLKELLSLENGENEKYKLHYPQMPMKDSTGNSSSKKTENRIADIQNLFDFESVHSLEPVHYDQSKVSNQVNKKDNRTSIKNLFDFKVEHLHEPVNYNRSKEDGQYKIGDKGVQNNQAIKREPADYDFQNKSNQLLQRRPDFIEDRDKDRSKRFRFNN